MIGPFDPTSVSHRLPPANAGTPPAVSPQDQQQKTEKPQPAETAQRPGNTPQEKKEALKDSNSTESRLLRELQTRDREVRAHELAHLSRAGQYARSGMSFDYTKGPDGHLYAAGGEVQIDTAPVPGDPRASLEKAQVIRMAALAPAAPSSQDQSVAAAAVNMATQARAELQQQTEQEGQERLEKSEADRSSADELNQRLDQTGALPPKEEEPRVNIFA